MSANGQLVFTDVDKVTFKGVGNTSNAVIDTLTGKIGVGIDSPSANLHVVGNCYISTNFELGGTMTMGTVTVEAQHELSAITATGNVTPHTIQFTNPTTAFTTTGNVEVGNELTVTGNVAVDTDTLFVDTVNDRVGVGTVTPTTALDVVGTVTATAFAGNASTASALATSVNIGGVAFDGSAAIVPTTFTTATFSGDVTVDSTTFHVDSTNNRVGVGTASPVAKLHIHGDLPQLRLSDDAANNPSWSFQGSGEAGEAMDLKYRRDDGAQSRLFLVGGEHADDAYKGWTFNTHNGTNALRIDKDGKVGIGTTSPQAKLHVYPTNTLNTEIQMLNFAPSFAEGYLGISATSTMINAVGADLRFKGRVYVSSGVGQDHEVMCLKPTGNVGIGTDSPDGTLHVQAGNRVHITAGTVPAFTGLSAVSEGRSQLVLSSRYSDLVIASSYVNNEHGSTLSFAAVNPSNTAEYRKFVINQGNWGTRKDFLDFGLSASAADANPHISINSTDTVLTLDGNNKRVGINQTNPYSALDTYNGGITQRHTGDITPWSGSIVSAPNAGITIGQTGYAITGGSAMYWNLALWSNHNLHISSRGKSTAYITGDITGGALNFTGQHRTFIKDVSFTQAIDLEGLIVSADQNKYIKMSGGIGAGSNAITTNESLPIVSISTKVNDKKCFGVISTSEDPETREDAYGRYVSIIPKENGDTRVYINSVGEGALWVTNINGSLESGDYITTSSVAGYGQKQDGAGLMNYTVAKITMDCDFSPVTQPIPIIKKELQDVNYWFKVMYDTITEAEYSNCTCECRTTVTETVYTNDNGEIPIEQYNSLEPTVQSTYTELIRTIYKSVGRESFKTEKDGYEHEVRNELVNVLDEHGQIQWEDHPTETEKAYKIRYLDANGVITDEVNGVHTAAFVGCTYHCG
jgi:hypothetical protein